MGKKRKTGAPAAVAKKKARSGPSESATTKNSRGGPVHSSNVFETLWTRRKFDVLGKKQKGEGRRAGLSRSAAVDKRKKTLLQEYKQRGKANAFLDHRFGEQDENLADDDKAILRFQRERMVQMQRKSKFNLQDDGDGEETEVLTHGGTALSTLDDFEVSTEDEDDDRGLDAEMVRELHFGGGLTSKNEGKDVEAEGEHKQQRSKKEIMEEVIAKSKFYKAQKSKEKEEDQDLKEKLDSEFTALAQSQALLSLVRPQKMNALKSLLAKGSTPESTSRIAENTSAEKEKPDDYDKLMKEMTFEMRAHASDRQKTAEEIAKDERTRLEDLEKKRKKRMLGQSDSDEEASEGSDHDENAGSQRQKRKKGPEISGDDLGENFVMEDEYQEKGWVDEVLAQRGKEQEEEESGGDLDSGDESGDDEDLPDDEEESDGDSDKGSDEESYSEDEWEQSDDEAAALDNIVPENFSRKVPNNKNNDHSASKSVRAGRELKGKDGLSDEEKRGKTGPKRAPKVPVEEVQNVDSLPYVIDAPQTLKDFQQLIAHRSVEDLAVAVQRIRTCNAISLAAENRRKMQVFYSVLLQYFAALAGEKPLCMRRVNLVVMPLIEMSAETPYFAAVCARQRIIRMRGQLSEKLKSSEDISCWPSMRTLLLLRLWSMIFPPSDFRHGVMTPAMLLMAEYLLRCPINCGHDIAVGSFICSLLLSVMRPAQRFCPEALNFLHALLLSALPKNSAKATSNLTLECPAYLIEFVASRPWLLLSNLESKSVELQPLDFVGLLTADDSSPIFESDSFRIGILQSVLQTLQGFVSIYKDLVSFPEVFSPIRAVVEAISRESVLPKGLLTLTLQVTESMTEKMKEHELRQPLRMRMHKPVPIKQFNPRFEENFAQGRDYDPDRERAEKKKLLRQLKREAKGAARELRKDNYFLAEERAKERTIAAEERDEKYRKAMSFLQEQESAFKSGQLGKGRKKRRR